MLEHNEGEAQEIILMKRDSALGEYQNQESLKLLSVRVLF